MSNTAIHSIVKQFTRDLSEVLLKAVIQQEPKPRHGRPPRRPTKILARGQKRPPQYIEKLKRRILDTLKKSGGGLSSENLQDQLKLTGNELQLPIKQLLDAKQLRHEGVARGRRYWLR